MRRGRPAPHLHTDMILHQIVPFADMFPCASQDPSSQVSSLVSQLSSNGVQYGQIWIDMQVSKGRCRSPDALRTQTDRLTSTLSFSFLCSETNPSCPWADPGTNCAWMQSAVSAMQANGINYGTYASEYMWNSIMGSDCTVASGGALWYA
jgi:hypothetical protein